MSRIPGRKPKAVVAAVAAALFTQAHTGARAAGIDLTSPAVAQAYVGDATPEKINAALAGLNYTISEAAAAIGSAQFRWASGDLFSQNDFCPVGACGIGGVAPVQLTLLQAASDADLGAPGAPVTLDNTTLQALASFLTPRNFTVGPGIGNIDTNGFDLTISGAVTTSGLLTKLGAGTLMLSGANPWGVAPIVAAGTLKGNTASLQTAITNDAKVEFDQAGDGTYAHVMSGTGSLDKTGAGTLTLTGANTYGGATSVLAGRLALQGAGTIGSGNLTVASGATFDLSAANNIVYTGAIAGSGGIALGVNRLASLAHASSTFSGVISGSGGFNKDGNGTLTLTGVNTFTGSTNIYNGTLSLAGAGRIAGGLAMAGGVFDISAADGSRQVTSLSGTGGTIALGANTLNVGSDNSDTTFSGAITGAGGLTKTGSGTLTLDSINSYSGVTTISQGTLAARTFSLSDTVVNNGTLTLFRNRETGVGSYIDAYSGNISGSGRLVKEGDDYVWLRGVNTYAGGTIVNAGVLIGNTQSLQGNITNNAGLAFYQVADGVHAGRIDGPGTLFVYGPGVLTLAGSNSYSGGTASSGTIRIAADSNLGAPSSPVLLAGGTLQTSADVSTSRPFILGNPGGTFDTRGFNLAASGIVSGAGTLIKSGAGSLALNAANTYTGPTFVTGGRLAVNGSITSNVTVGSGGELGGTGIVIGSVSNSGRIARGDSTGNINVAGSVTFAPGSALTVKADAAGNSDKLVVGGAQSRAMLQGGTVDVQAASGAYHPQTRYTILTAQGGVTGTFADTTSNLAFLTPSLNYGPNDVFLTLTRNGFGFETVALSGNQNAVGRVFTQMQGSASGDMALVVNALTSLSASDARVALDSIAAAGRTASAQVATFNQRAVSQNVSARLGQTDAGGQLAPATGLAPGGVKLAFEESVRSDASPVYAQARGDHAFGRGAYDTATKHGLWLRGFGGTGHLDGDASNAGASYHLGGVVAGYDYALSQKATLGVFGSYSKPEVEQGGAASHTETESVQAGLYGRYRAGAAYVDGIVSYARNSTDTSRIVTVGALNRTATASFDGSTVAVQAEVGYTLGGRVEVTPIAGLLWLHQRQDAYTEQGAGALNLVVPGRSSESLRSMLGVRASYPVETAGGTRLALEARAGWAHEFRDQGALSARLAGDPVGASFSVTGISIPRDSAVLGVGIGVEATRNLRVYAELSTEVNSMQRTYAAAAGLRYQW